MKLLQVKSAVLLCQILNRNRPSHPDQSLLWNRQEMPFPIGRCCHTETECGNQLTASPSGKLRTYAFAANVLTKLKWCPMRSGAPLAFSARPCRKATQYAHHPLRDPSSPTSLATRSTSEVRPPLGSRSRMQMVILEGPSCPKAIRSVKTINVVLPHGKWHNLYWGMRGWVGVFLLPGLNVFPVRVEPIFSQVCCPGRWLKKKPSTCELVSCTNLVFSPKVLKFY